MSGIKIYFIGVVGDNRFIVERLKMYFFEVVVWNVVVGSLKKCFLFEEGIEFLELIIEFYYKNDDFGDFMIN